MSETLREALAAAASPTARYSIIDEEDGSVMSGLRVRTDDEIVDAILAMPELQAIGQVLHRVLVYGAAGVDARWRLLWNDLPDVVKQWAVTQ